MLNSDLVEIPTTLLNGVFDNRVEEEVHDVAITDVTPSPTSVTTGESVTVNVTVENEGDFAETFDVTAYYDGTVIDTITSVSLNSGESNVLPFTWDTTGVTVGIYVIGANATVVPDEEDVSDNYLEDGTVEVVEAPPPHDVAVTDVSPSPTSVTVGDTVTIDVTVENQGTEAETFNITA
jgi:predicted thioesterase